MMTDSIRILFASDLHFGIRSLSSHEMTKAFCDTVFPLLADTDIFFINGDFFDTEVIFGHHGFDPIYDLIMDLFTLCDENKVTLRLLRGTYEHDRQQCERFEPLYRNGHYSFDFKFVNGIELEEIWIGSRELRIAYVSDDLPPNFASSDDIVAALCNKMVEMGWDNVDYACMHGFFDFTFPDHVSTENRIVFRQSQFDFVTKLIDVGHVHQYQINGKAISNGSFDRLVFGDESPKGLIKVLDYPDHYTAQFIENKQAAIFDTLTFKADATTEIIREQLVNHLTARPSDRRRYLRFQLESMEHREAIQSWMKEHHPTIGLKFKKIGEEDKQVIKPSSLVVAPLQKREAPTRQTIASLIKARLPLDCSLTIEKIDAHLEPPDSKG
jgi:hypothetical protein